MEEKHRARTQAISSLALLLPFMSCKELSMSVTLNLTSLLCKAEMMTASTHRLLRGAVRTDDIRM